VSRHCLSIGQDSEELAVLTLNTITDCDLDNSTMLIKLDVLFSKILIVFLNVLKL